LIPSPDRRLFLLITQLSLVCVLLLSVAGYLGRLSKYAELASHFRLQYLLGSSACLLACFLSREWAWASAAAVGVAINLVEVASWSISGRNLAGNRAGWRRVKLILANVNFENTAHETFIAFAQRHAPDILVVQEVDAAWCDSLQALKSLYPFSETKSEDGGSGMALYSRFQFEPLTIDLPESGARPGILVNMKVDGVSVSLLSLHPRTPVRTRHFKLRNEMLAAAADCLQNLPAPKVLVGDLNITPWSHYYWSFVKQTRLAPVRKGFGLLPSWPAFLFFKWLMIPLDHCLVSGDIKVIEVRTGERIGSDHLPLIIELEIPQNQTTQSE